MSKNDESKQMHCVEFGLYVPKNYKKSLFVMFRNVSDYKNEFIRYIWNEINKYGEQDKHFAESVKVIQEQNKVYGKAVNKSDLDSVVKESYEYVEKVILEDKIITSFTEMQKTYMRISDAKYNIYIGDDIRNNACKSVIQGFMMMFGLYKKVKTIGKNVTEKDYKDLLALVGKPIHPINKETNEVDINKVQGTLQIIYKNNLPYLRMWNVSENKLQKHFEHYNKLEDKTNKKGYPQHEWIELKLHYNPKDKLQKQIVENKYIGSTKLVRTYKKGEWRYFVQINFDGISPVVQDINFNNNKVGININTEMVAIVRIDGSQEIIPITPDTPRVTEDIQNLTTYINNSRRIMNPTFYKKDGQIKYTKKEMAELGLHWVYSNGYIKARKQLNNAHRVLRLNRKRNNETLAKYILQSGNEFILDRNQYRAWQMKMNRMNKHSNKRYNNGIRKANDYAKQIQNYAPGYFSERIKSVCEQLQLPCREVRTFNSSNYNHFTQDNDLFIELNKRFVTFKKDEDFIDDIAYNETALRLIDTFGIVTYNGKRYILQRDLYASSKLLFLNVVKEKRKDKNGKEYEVSVDVFNQEEYSKWFDEVFYPKHLEYLQKLIDEYNLGYDINGLILGNKNK